MHCDKVFDNASVFDRFCGYQSLRCIFLNVANVCNICGIVRGIEGSIWFGQFSHCLIDVWRM